ncbi:hypothetical protein F5X98DRAFT_337800 [Xylaria grammica]|nr:hypothetical protein F5X98DRAFT_337800 [Xylaria grammica]
MTTVYPAVTSSGVVTSFVPLTTTFTPSAECSGHFRLNGPSLVAFDPGYGLDIDSDVHCLPSAVTTWWEQGRLGDNSEDHTAISLGPLICPYEWKTVAASARNKLTTLAMCCPSGYYLANGIPGFIVGDCLSEVSSGARLTFASTSAYNSDTWYTRTTSLTRSSTVGAIAVVGWNIKAGTPTPTPTSTRTKTKTTFSPSTVISSSTSTLNPVSLSPATPSSPQPSNNSTQRVPNTALGIGLGVGLGVIGVATLLGFVYLMKRQKQRKTTSQVNNHQGNGTVPQQQPPQGLQGDEPVKHELYGSGRYELQGGSQSRPPLIELHG